MFTPISPPPPPSLFFPSPLHVHSTSFSSHSIPSPNAQARSSLHSFFFPTSRVARRQIDTAFGSIKSCQASFPLFFSKRNFVKFIFAFEKWQIFKITRWQPCSLLQQNVGNWEKTCRLVGRRGKEGGSLQISPSPPSFFSHKKDRGVGIAQLVFIGWFGERRGGRKRMGGGGGSRMSASAFLHSLVQ